MEEFIRNMSQIEEKGIAVDIDETLAWTVGSLVKLMQEKFGNPENLTVEELVEKYRYTWNVPYWQSEEAFKYVKEKILLADFFSDLSLVPSSQEILNLISKVVPIACYITARSEDLFDVTKDWLNKNGFPSAPVICKPRLISDENRDLWKAKVMEKLYPNVIGIIDDNDGILKYLPEDYQGKIFLYSHKENDSSFVIACPNWDSVKKEVLDYFSSV